MNSHNLTYFDSFGIEHIPKEIKKLINNKNIKASICRIRANHSTICGYFCTGFVGFMLKTKSLLDCTNLFSSNKYRKNGEIKLKNFQ